MTAELPVESAPEFHHNLSNLIFSSVCSGPASSWLKGRKLIWMHNYNKVYLLFLLKTSLIFIIFQFFLVFFLLEFGFQDFLLVLW